MEQLAAYNNNPTCTNPHATAAATPADDGSYDMPDGFTQDGVLNTYEQPVLLADQNQYADMGIGSNPNPPTPPNQVRGSEAGQTGSALLSSVHTSKTRMCECTNVELLRGVSSRRKICNQIM